MHSKLYPLTSLVPAPIYHGVAINREEDFDVVMSYRETGATNFDLLRNRPVVKEIQIDLTELMAD